MRLTIILIVLGVFVSLMSALEPKVAWIASFCGVFGGGCSDTVAYSLLQVPVALWGMLYYACLGVAALRRPQWLFWGMMAGFGVELALVRVMLEMQFVCVLCAANGLVMLGLFFCLFDKKRLPELIAVSLVFYIVSHALISGADESRPNRRSAEDPQRILATVGSREITAGDVMRPLATKLYKARRTIHEWKRSELENRIDAILLEMEAAAKKVTVEQLKQKIEAQTPPVDAHEIDFNYQTKAYHRWGIADGPEADVKERIRTVVYDQRVAARIRDHCHKLKETTPVTILLEEPPLPLTDIVVGDSPAIGPVDAPVTVVEFSDYLCPSCRKSHAIVRRIRETYAGQIRWVFKDLPLNIHPGARELALAARCAGEQGRFWDYQDRLFSTKKKPDPEAAARYAEQLGMDLPAFAACLSDPLRVETLDADIAAAGRAGIAATPTIVVNGRLRTGVPSFEAFSEMLDAALEEAGVRR